MSSQTAEVCYDTLMLGLRYVTDYFKHIGYEELSTKVMLKCLTTKNAFSVILQRKSKAIIFASLTWQDTLSFHSIHKVNLLIYISIVLLVAALWALI